MHKKSHSPWGKVRHHEPIGDLGLFHHSTAGHGGIYVPAEMLGRMPGPYRSGHWYEEDCEWAKVALSFPSGIPEEDMEHARRTAIGYFPHAYMAVTGITIPVEDSFVLRQERDRESARGRFVVISATGSGSAGERADVPPGWVGCHAVLGGRCERGRYDEASLRHILIPAADYQQRSSIGFIVRKQYPAWPLRGQPVHLPAASASALLAAAFGLTTAA